MVKNKSGGSGHKKMGRKFVNAPKSNRLRLSQDDDEIYACVTKLLGNGMAHIINSNDTKMLLHIRNKFRGRSKRDNTIKSGTIILAGKRTFETVKEGKLENCDLLEVYTNSEINSLTNDHFINFNCFNKVEGFNKKNEDDGFEFVLEQDENKHIEDIINNEINNEINNDINSQQNNYIATSNQNNNDDFNIDDI
jgi:hypothetical protein|tara:strand:+ start:1783 stop:2364 length:582 start_codon:yes stop_codon:yes gene_type:complete